MTEKSHVGMLHLICPICCKTVNTDILLDRRLKQSLEKDNYDFSDKFCDDCQKHIDDNRKPLIEIHGTINKGDMLNCATANRTGRIFYLNNDVVEKMFPPEALTSEFVFIDVELGDKLTASIKDQNES